MFLKLKAVRLTGLLFLIILTLIFSVKTISCQETGGPSVYDRLLRIEIPAKSDNETYKLIPCGKKGIILFYRSVETAEQDKVKWYFTLYDKNLLTVWTKSIGLVNTLEYKDFSTDVDTVCFVFRNSGKAKETEFNFQIIRLDLQNGVFRGNIWKMPENSEIIDFDVYRSIAYLGFNVKNEPARLMIFNLQTGNQNIFPLSLGWISSFTQIYLDTANGKLFAAIRKMIVRNQSEFALSVFDLEGKLISEIPVTSASPEHNLNAMRFIPIDTNEILVAGSYGSPPVQKGSSRNEMPGESTGFFFSRIYNNQQQSISYYNFLELKNANQLITEKNVQNLKKKAQKKEKDTDEY